MIDYHYEGAAVVNMAAARGASASFDSRREVGSQYFISADQWHFRYGPVSLLVYECAQRAVPFALLGRFYDLGYILRLSDLLYISTTEKISFDNIDSKEHNRMYLLLLAEALAYEGL